MNDLLMECLANPIKCKLLTEIQSKQPVTTKQLAEIHSDIPQATLYRYLKRMTADGIIKVVEEKQVRNVKEKVYAASIDFGEDIEKKLKENSGEVYMNLFQQYTMGLLREFQEYTSQKDIDIQGDGSGFSYAPFYATTEELNSLMLSIGELIKPLTENQPTPERKMRTLGLVITPPKTIK